MDKTQTPPGRDGGSEDAGKKEHYGKPVKAKDAVKDAEKELNKAMDKNKARKMYELADRLSKVDTSKLNEQQLVEHTGMIKRLGQELKIMKEGAAAQFSPEMHDQIKKATKQQLMQMAYDLGGDAMHAKNEYALLLKAQDELTQGTGPAVSEPDEEPTPGPGPTPKPSGGGMMPKFVKFARTVSEPLRKGMFAADKAASQFGNFAGQMTRGAAQQARAAGQRVGMESVEEAPEDLHTSYNVVKMSGALEVDPRTLRTAIARSMKGNPTRTDTMTLANAFINLLKNSDDNAIQQFANLIKSGNPRAVPQESTAAMAEANAFVDAMRQVKKGEKFTVGGKEFTKTTTHGDEEVKENISTEAYDRLKRVFDFSNFKG